LIIKTAIALAVAAIPEGLPIVATLALARGLWRMARRNVLINRLAAVETLGATTVIFTDKTGTLTENRMAVRHIRTSAGEVELGGGPVDARGEFRRAEEAVEARADPELLALLEVAILCNNASWNPRHADQPAIGEPMEVALIVAGAKAGMDHAALREALPEVEEIAFDPSVNMMATYHLTTERSLRVAVKGAPEAVLAACTGVQVGEDRVPLTLPDRARWLERNSAMAATGLRILAFAQKSADEVDADPYSQLTLLGLAGLIDPPRADAREAVQACQDAGVRVVIVTGDQAPTARYIATAVGLSGDNAVINGAELPPPEELSASQSTRILRASIFARVSPEQKLDLIRLSQRRGEVVAMTGDGVNDAPALKAADIGIAMGKRGTEVAREASDMVLRDDAFASIVHAVAQGRVVFGNIRSFVRYLISCNLSEIIVVVLGVLLQTALPILPLQILFLNLVTDVFPALALGLGEGDDSVMERPPRDPEEPILTKRHWIQNVVFGSVIALSVLGALLISQHVLGFDETKAVTVSFATLALAQLWHVLNMRERGSDPVANQVTRNRYVWMALALCVGLLLAAVYVPPLAAALDTVDPGASGWLVALVMSLLPTVFVQVWLGSGPRRGSSSVH
ncbi:MAG: cation-transporting P-type ATPase, partial [Thermoleophilia bacterium]|nr:cation-transporting P-type ATPase [Thermoleophilia bacterium]